MRRTKDQIQYEDKLRQALSEEERYMGSVFVTPKRAGSSAYQGKIN